MFFFYIIKKPKCIFKQEQMDEKFFKFATNSTQQILNIYF